MGLASVRALDWLGVQGACEDGEIHGQRTMSLNVLLAVLRNMASTGRFDGLPELLRRRITARALSWLWLNDEVIASRLLNPRLLGALLDAQQPRLTRMTLQQLAQLYFRRFDQLDERDGLRELLVAEPAAAASRTCRLRRSRARWQTH